MIHAIFAMDSAGGIGLENKLPWENNSTDMKHFKDITSGHVVVMGRNTWESISEQYRPLPNRVNAVVSSTTVRHPNMFIHNIHSDDIIKGIKMLANNFNNKEIFIIGGKQLIMSTLDIIEHMYVTQMYGTYEADVKLDKRKLFENMRCTGSSPLVDHCIFEEYTNETISK